MTTPLLLTHSYIQAPINSCLECCWSLLTCLPSFIFVLYSVFSAQLPQWSFQNIRQFMLPTLLRTLLPALKSEMIWLHYFSYLICYYSLLPHCFLQHTKHFLTLGSLHWLFPLSGIHFPQDISIANSLLP